MNLPVPHPHASPAVVLPSLVADAGTAAQFAYDEMLNALTSNHHTRIAYERAIRRFMLWAEQQTKALHSITPGMVGKYITELPGRPATRKLNLAALRRFFDVMVLRHVIILNPASSVRGERYTVQEGLTPEITVDQAKQLLKSIAGESIIDLRDKAILSVLAYTGARVGAVAKLKIGSLLNDGSQYQLRFEEKNNRQRQLPVRHDLQKILLAYLGKANPKEAPKATPFFRTTNRKTGKLSDQGVTGMYIYKMLKRRLKIARLPDHIVPHSLRACVVTDLLTQGLPLEDVQLLVGHSDPRTTRLYDRRQREVTRNLVERISI